MIAQKKKQWLKAKFRLAGAIISSIAVLNGTMPVLDYAPFTMPQADAPVKMNRMTGEAIKLYGLEERRRHLKRKQAGAAHDGENGFPLATSPNTLVIVTPKRAMPRYPHAAAGSALPLAAV